MARTMDVRWSDPDRCWVSDCGEPTVDRSGRHRRKRVFFREDDEGAIPFGPKPRSEGYRRARAALAAFVERQHARAREPGPPRGSALDVIGAWRAELRASVRRRERKARTAKDLSEAAAAWADWPGHDPIGYREASSVRAEDLARWVEAQQAEGLKANYIRRRVAAVKQCWSWAAGAGLIPRDTLAGVKRPRAPKGTGRRPDRNEWRRWRRRRWAIARSKGPRLKSRVTDRICLLLVRAIADTGARPDELCRARWEELDWDLLAVVPPEHKNDGHDKVRAIFFPRRWARTLRWLRGHGHPEYLFWHKWVRPRKPGIVRRGDPEHGAPWGPNALAQRLKKWGMPCWPYDLRRLVASELADAGLEYRRIADLLGNSEDLVRAVYVRRELASLREEFDRAREVKGGR